MQTLTSQWGREPLEVADEIPTAMLRFKLGRTHVGESDEYVTGMVSAAIDKAPVPFTAEQRDQTLAAALWLHHENRAEYGRVMSGNTVTLATFPLPDRDGTYWQVHVNGMPVTRETVSQHDATMAFERVSDELSTHGRKVRRRLFWDGFNGQETEL